MKIDFAIQSISRVFGMKTGFDFQSQRGAGSPDISGEYHAIFASLKMIGTSDIPCSSGRGRRVFDLNPRDGAGQRMILHVPTINPSWRSTA